MQSSPYTTSTAASWMTPNDSNINLSTANFWSNGGFRKRKAAATDLEEKRNQKMFVTEEKMLKEMQTLSLDLVPPDINNEQTSAPQIDDFVEAIIDDVETTKVDKDHKSEEEEEDDDDDDKKEEYSERTRFELHKLLRESLKQNDLQDSVLSKLCEIERRKLTMQIVPYVPIHPAQLKNDNPKPDDETKDKQIDNQTSSSIVSDTPKNNNSVFKIPSVPTLYTVEEPPCDDVIRRNPTMKRSYSQSDQQSSSLLVTELRPGIDDFSRVAQSSSAYFVVEPTANSLSQSSASFSSASISSDGPSVRISEVIDDSAPTNEFSIPAEDDDIDMQSIASSDTGDKMDDD